MNSKRKHKKLKNCQPNFISVPFFFQFFAFDNKYVNIMLKTLKKENKFSKIVIIFDDAKRKGNV